MSENELSSYAEKLHKDVLNLLADILPNAINEVLNKFIEDYKKTQNTTTQHQKSTESQPKVDMPPITHGEFQRFSNENYDYMTYMLRKREDIFFKLTRCKSLTTLYGECLSQSPQYVPKTFRKDNYHLLSPEEYTKLRVTELQRLKTEKEILQLRVPRFTSHLHELDTEIQNFVKNTQGPKKETKEVIIQRWTELTNKDTERINKKWVKNISNLKVIFKRDQENLRKTVERRFPTHNVTNTNDSENNEMNSTRDVIDNEPTSADTSVPTHSTSESTSANNTVTSTPTINSSTALIDLSSQRSNTVTSSPNALITLIDLSSQPSHMMTSPTAADISTALIDLPSQRPSKTTNIDLLTVDVTTPPPTNESTISDGQRILNTTNEYANMQSGEDVDEETTTASKNELRPSKTPIKQRLRSSISRGEP